MIVEHKSGRSAASGSHRRSGPGNPSKQRFLSRSTLAADFDLDLATLPRTLCLLFENLVANGRADAEAVHAFRHWLQTREPGGEIPFSPSRILMQDTAGVAALADLAALRDTVAARGGHANAVRPAVPIDLVIDHSVVVNFHGAADALARNMALEFARNRERYTFFKWCETAFDRLRVVPPGNGICHQINLEALAQVVIAAPGHEDLMIGESVIGTDSHTTMVNALGVLGWGVGGIEAEAVALGEPIMVQLPAVTAVRLTGRRQPGVTATDIALAVTHRLREAGVVGHFVEFVGDGLDALSLADRAAIANMAPEYGATCGFFPVDDRTLDYLRVFGRPDEHLDLIKAYARATGLWRDDTAERSYSASLTVALDDLGHVMAGPKRPQDQVRLQDVPASLRRTAPTVSQQRDADACGDGALAIAAITSCTNTANPHLLIAAGLLARRARRRGLTRNSWVKTSLAPGSRAIADLLARSGLQDDLDALGFNVVGFGCTTCVGNSGELEPLAAMAARDGALLGAVISGNRNFEGRIHPAIAVNYLASPPLVVAYAIAGNLLVNVQHEPLTVDSDGRPVMLSDLWPTDDECEAIYQDCMTKPQNLSLTANIGSEEWQQLDAPTGTFFPWDVHSTYVRRPTFFDEPSQDRLTDLIDARPLLLLGDSITTDHISPISRILPGSPAAAWLQSAQIERSQWGSYGERRGNHEVMWRGTFAHPTLANALADGAIGPLTTIEGTEAPLTIFDAACRYLHDKTPTVIFAGREYGTGSARDWAAKGTRLMGVRAAIAESFERIHRANLVGAGVLPIQIALRAQTLGVTAATRVSISGLGRLEHPAASLSITLRHGNGRLLCVPAICRLDTLAELRAFRAGGIFSVAERLR